MDAEKRQKRFLDLLLVATLLVGGIAYLARRQPELELRTPSPIVLEEQVFDPALCSRRGTEPHPPRGYGAGSTRPKGRQEKTKPGWCSNRDDTDIRSTRGR
jgi:hypothetical protein